MKLLLISNTYMGKPVSEGGTAHPFDYAQPWIQQHFDASPEHPKKVLFVPYAKKDAQKYIDSMKPVFQPMGIELISAASSEHPAELLDKVDGIFVGGGNTFRLLKTIQENGLMEAMQKKVKEGMPYMGSSAGTSIAGPTIRTSNDMPIVEPPKGLTSLGFVPFQINAHFSDGHFYSKEGDHYELHNGETRRERLAEFHEENATPVVGVREGSALRIEDKKVELLGGKSALIFKRGEEPVEVTDGKALSALMEGKGQGFGGRGTTES